MPWDNDRKKNIWSDMKLKTISRAFLNGSALKVVVEFGLEITSLFKCKYLTV